MHPAARRGLGALLALGIGISPLARALEFRSADGRFRAVVERNQTHLWDADRPTPHVLAGYRQGPFLPNVDITLGGAVDTAVFSADGRTVAVAGTCRGYSGVAEPRKPRCITGFIQLWDTQTGALAGVLEPYWTLVHDESKVLALDISPDGQTVAALIRVRWTDCSYGGTELHLQVWTREGSVGRSLWHRQIEQMREGAATVGRYSVRLTPEAAVTVLHHRGERTHSRLFPPPRSASARP